MVTEDDKTRRQVLGLAKASLALSGVGVALSAVGLAWQMLPTRSPAPPGRSLELDLSESVGIADSLTLSELTFTGTLSVGVELSQPRIIV